MKKLVTFGNAKLPKTTMIFNMGSSANCPSRKLNLCECAEVCYALKPEIIYPAVLPYRERQANYWKSNSAKVICTALDDIIKRKRIKPTLFRYNEAGDFYNKKCIKKLSKIATHLLEVHNIVTYGYTARKDLDFSKATFLVKGSNNDSGNNGKTIILYKDQPVPKGFFVCPGSCKTCTMCSSDKKINIAFHKH